jgi:ABC-type sugar transport system ATPase subunit
MSDRAPLLRLRNVGRRYASGEAQVIALDDVSLEIASGEFVAIMGQSGSGKSTLMNIIGCLDRPTRGTYRLAGHDVSKLDADARAFVRNRLLGFIFQGFNLLARTSAAENVELPLVYRGIGARDQVGEARWRIDTRQRRCRQRRRRRRDEHRARRQRRRSAGCPRHLPAIAREERCETKHEQRSTREPCARHLAFTTSTKRMRRSKIACESTRSSSPLKLPRVFS